MGAVPVMAPMAIVIATSGGSAGGFRDAARLTGGPLDHHPTRLPDFAIRTAAKMTPDQIAESHRMVREWKPTK
jgi:hypothetical protein